MYHKVWLEKPTMWWVEVDSFYRQLCELQHKKVVYLDEYDPANPDHVVITFDGIYVNVLEYAAPLLKEFGYPFELFMTSDYLGKDNSFDTIEPLAEFVNEEQLKELVTMGGRLQWHTRSHPNMKQMSDREEIIRELEIPDPIKKLDPKGFTWFAYPYGEFNEMVVEETKKRFQGAVSCVEGNDTDRYVLNRITVTSDTSFAREKITVIVPSYNYGHFLVEAVESVLRQTRRADEIIIVDDASSDNTWEVAELFRKKYPELIKTIRNDENLGIVKTFNKAVEQATGGYVVFLGADNRYRSDFLEKTAGSLDTDEKLGIAYTDFALFGPRASQIYGDFPKEWQGAVREETFYCIKFPDFSEEIKANLEKRNVIHGSSMFRKAAFEAVGGYADKSDMPEDHNFFYRIIQKGWNAIHVGEPLLEYRQHSQDQANIKVNTLTELNFYRSQYKDIVAEIEAFHVELDDQIKQLEKEQLQLDADIHFEQDYINGLTQKFDAISNTKFFKLWQSFAALKRSLTGK